MENTIQIMNDQLVVIPQGKYKVASLKKKLVIPLKNVLGATLDSGILNEFKGLRCPGTNLPNYAGGTYLKNNEKVFFNVKHSSRPIVIQLQNEQYSRLVLGVDAPEKTVNLINNNI